MAIEKSISKTLLNVSAYAVRADVLCILAQEKSLNEDNIEHSVLGGFFKDEFMLAVNRNWASYAVCYSQRPTSKMICVGVEGEVVTYGNQVDIDEQISPQPIAIRNLGVIEGEAFACGMDREVFHRLDDNRWDNISAPSSEESKGFEAIQGFSKNEIYAVGWGGEIWLRSDKKWSLVSELTNVILTGVCCAEDGNVYVCGQHGTLIKGRHSVWEIVDLGDTAVDFWDIHWFNGELYLASMLSLFKLSSDLSLEPVNFGEDEPSTCYRLSSADGMLWSVGSQDVFKFDGNKWNRVD